MAGKSAMAALSAVGGAAAAGGAIENGAANTAATSSSCANNNGPLNGAQAGGQGPHASLEDDTDSFSDDERPLLSDADADADGDDGLDSESDLGADGIGLSSSLASAAVGGLGDSGDRQMGPVERNFMPTVPVPAPLVNNLCNPFANPMLTPADFLQALARQMGLLGAAAAGPAGPSGPLPLDDPNTKPDQKDVSATSTQSLLQQVKQEQRQSQSPQSLSPNGLKSCVKRSSFMMGDLLNAKCEATPSPLPIPALAAAPADEQSPQQPQSAQALELLRSFSASIRAAQHMCPAPDSPPQSERSSRDFLGGPPLSKVQKVST